MLAGGGGGGEGRGWIRAREIEGGRGRKRQVNGGDREKGMG